DGKFPERWRAPFLLGGHTRDFSLTNILTWCHCSGPLNWCYYLPLLLLRSKGGCQASPWMMLCGVSVVFNSLGDVFGLMSCKRSSENGQVLVGFQSTEAFGCLHHAGGGPAQRHRGVSPSLHVATDAAHGPHHILN